MKGTRIVTAAIAIVFLAFPALAGEVPQTDKDAKPAPIDENVTQGALRVKQEDGTVVECPLKHTDVTGEISGFIARVKVTQTFHNPFKEKIEAVYVFPLPHGSAVDDMTMVIGDRRIVGLIKKRDVARFIYEEALRRGQTAALLEQERPNIFVQSVGNIEPGQEIKIEISYLDVLEYDMGEYTFHFPMVVGPRYNPPGHKEGIGAVPVGRAGESGQKTEIPYLKPEQRNGHDISLSLTLDAGVPVRDMRSTNHKAEVMQVDASRASVRMSPADSIPNKDFVLKYKVVGEKPEVAVLAHNIGYGSGGYFMLMIQPKLDDELKKAPPREICFLIDVSGSMRGKPTEQVKRTMEEFFKLSKPDDTIQVVTFAGQAYELFEKYVPATKANVERALNFTRGIRGGGGTRMLEGIKKVVDAPVDPKRIRIVVMLSDGYIGNEKEIINEVGRKCGDQIRFWTIGIGNSVNRFLIDGVARQGGGMGKVLGLDDDPAKLVPEIVERIHRAQLAKIEIDWAALGVYDIYPMKVPDLWAGRPVILHGRYFQPGGATIMINGLIEGEPISYPLDVSLPDAQPKHGVLSQVWARKKIEDLTYQMMGSEVPELVDEVTSTALNYRLMSKYTSFVAVDEKDVGTIRGPATPPRRVTVPVPMPDGVSWYGVFGSAERQLFADKGMVVESLKSLDGAGGAAGRFHAGYVTGGGKASRESLRRYGGAAKAMEVQSLLGRVNATAGPMPSFAAGAPARKRPALRLGIDKARARARETRVVITAKYVDIEKAALAVEEDDAYAWGGGRGGGGSTNGIVEMAKKAAGPETGKDKVKFETKQASVKAALEWLSKETGVKITIADEAKDAAEKTKVALRTNREITLARALDWIQQQTGFSFTYKGGAIQLVRSNWQLADERRREADKAEADGKLATAYALYRQAYILASFSRGYRGQRIAQMALTGLLRVRQALLDQYVENLPDLKKQLDLVIRRRPLQDAIAAVEKAGGVKISVRGGSFGDVMELLELDRLHVVYLDLRNATVAQALDWLLDPFQLDWQPDGKSVVVGTSRRLAADAPAPWVYSIGYIATPIKEELGEDKAANRRLLVEASQRILDAIRSVVRTGEARLLDRSRLMVYGTAADHEKAGAMLTVFRGLKLDKPVPVVVETAHSMTTAKRYAARAELRARRIALKKQQAVLNALYDYSWKLMAGALAGEADLEALTWLQFAWNHEECTNALKADTPLAARALWCVSAATRLLQKNADVRALAEKAVAAAAPNAPDGSVATLEYALAARDLAAAGIKNDKLGDEFIAAATEALKKGGVWIPAVARALLDDLNADDRAAIATELRKGADTVNGDDAVVLFGLACRRVGGDAWASFRADTRADIIRRSRPGGDALLVTNRLSDPRLVLAR